MEELIVDNFSEIKIGLDIFEKDKNEQNDNRFTNTTDNSNTNSQSADSSVGYNDNRSVNNN